MFIYVRYCIISIFIIIGTCSVVVAQNTETFFSKKLNFTFQGYVWENNLGYHSIHCNNQEDGCAVHNQGVTFLKEAGSAGGAFSGVAVLDLRDSVTRADIFISFDSVTATQQTTTEAQAEGWGTMYIGSTCTQEEWEQLRSCDLVNWDGEISSLHDTKSLGWVYFGGGDQHPTDTTALANIQDRNRYGITLELEGFETAIYAPSSSLKTLKIKTSGRAYNKLFGKIVFCDKNAPDKDADLKINGFCGDGTQAGDAKIVGAIQRPTIQVYTVRGDNPIDIVVPGDTITVRWDCGVGNSVHPRTKFGPLGDLVEGPIPSKGKVTFIADTSTSEEFTIVCIIGGTPFIVEGIGTIIIQGEALEFDVSPTLVNPGDRVTVSWSLVDRETSNNKKISCEIAVGPEGNTQVIKDKIRGESQESLAYSVFSETTFHLICKRNIQRNEYKVIYEATANTVSYGNVKGYRKIADTADSLNMLGGKIEYILEEVTYANNSITLKVKGIPMSVIENMVMEIKSGEYLYWFDLIDINASSITTNNGITTIIVPVTTEPYHTGFDEIFTASSTFNIQLQEVSVAEGAQQQEVVNQQKVVKTTNQRLDRIDGER